MACKSQNNTPPANVLTTTEMTAVIMDLYIAEAKTMKTKAQSDTTLAVYQIYKDAVYKKHKLDTATFNRSFRWYTSHTEMMDKVYQEVVDSLGLREEKRNWN